MRIDMPHYGIRVRKIKESLAALHIQRRHKIDKDDMCTEYTWLCTLTMDKTTTCFYTQIGLYRAVVFSIFLLYIPCALPYTATQWFFKSGSYFLVGSFSTFITMYQKPPFHVKLIFILQCYNLGTHFCRTLIFYKRPKLKIVLTPNMS